MLAKRRHAAGEREKRSDNAAYEWCQLNMPKRPNHVKANVLVVWLKSHRTVGSTVHRSKARIHSISISRIRRVAGCLSTWAWRIEYYFMTRRHMNKAANQNAKHINVGHKIEIDSQTYMQDDLYENIHIFLAACSGRCCHRAGHYNPIWALQCCRLYNYRRWHRYLPGHNLWHPWSNTREQSNDQNGELKVSKVIDYIGNICLFPFPFHSLRS